MMSDSKSDTDTYLQLLCCVVSGCNNTSIKTPDKQFIHVSKSTKTRKEWWLFAKNYFCEDHCDKFIDTPTLKGQHFGKGLASDSTPQTLHTGHERPNTFKDIPKAECQRVGGGLARDSTPQTLHTRNEQRVRGTPLHVSHITAFHSHIGPQTTPAMHRRLISKKENGSMKYYLFQETSNKPEILSAAEPDPEITHLSSTLEQNVVDEDTKSAESIATFKCDYCDIEYLHEGNLFDHIQNKHLINEENEETDSERTRNKKPKIQDNFFRGEQVFIDEEYSHETHLLNHIKKDNEETDSAESVPTFTCDYCDLEYLHETHLLHHIQEQHVDIKPEIFQCSKCPSSFLNEEEMLKHALMMHEHPVNTYMSNVKSNKRDGKNNKNTKDLVIEKGCQNNFEDYSFAKVGIETQIKRELSDPIEDIELPGDHRNFNALIPALDPMYRPDFSVNQCDRNNVNGSSGIELDLPENIKVTNKNFNPETLTIKNENPVSYNNCYLDFCKNYRLPQSELKNTENNPDIKCSHCRRTFPSQEDLADHMHELTYSRLCAVAKQHPDITQLLDRHRDFDTSQKKKLNLEIVGHSPDLEQKDIQKLDPCICRSGSKPLRRSLRIGKKDKICIKCKNNEIQSQKRQKSNIKFKNCTDVDYSNLNSKQLLENTQKKTQTPNKLGKNRVNKKINIKDVLQDTFMFDDNDLLKPLRQEDEKILVIPYDPKLCKNCRIPLKIPENSEQTNPVCDKCKAQESSNEKRRKTNEKRKKSKDNIDKNSWTKKLIAKNEFGCLICKSKFSNKLGLREHVARSHL